MRALKSNKAVIFGAWLVNLIVFTAMLWCGHYYQSQGVEWIKIPVEVTLITSGVLKAVLSTLAFLILFKNPEFSDEQ